MIDSDVIYETALTLLKKSVLEIPEDWLRAFKDASAKETGSAKELWDFWWAQYEIRKKEAEKGRPEGVFCGDVGQPCFFVTIGTEAKVDPEINWWGALVKAVGDPSYLKLVGSRVYDPITMEELGDNTGINMPYVEYNIARDEDCVELTAVPKGGGSEIYSNFQMMTVPDPGAIKGIRKFVIDSVVKGCVGGKTCAPNIYGVGIGGTSAMAMKFAWEAASLRPYGSRHPVDWIAKLEDELLEDANYLGIGPMSKGGKVVLYDLHVEYSWGHSVLMPVAVVPQCNIIHRTSAKIFSDGKVEYRPYPELWFKESRRTVEEYLKKSKK